jgi:hypothetical protein
VKTAAVKKLFADPRFNVRDMMDVYADDYSQPDPLPDSMLRKLVAAKALRLFDTDEPEPGTAENADNAASQKVAQSDLHANTDLRLQQDDAPAGQGAGAGVEPGPDASHDPVPPRGGSVPEGGQG